MNLMDILLLEAIRINNGKEAYELIKNKKIGVKIHPSYDIGDEKDSKDFIFILDQIINKSSASNKVFTVQFFINKIPMNQMLTFADRSYIYKIIDYRNKPWAKNVPGYSDFISLNGKEVKLKSLEGLLLDLESEAQKHGHGNNKDIINVYNDGTWSLQIPKSWNGAKSASFYGKKNGKQIPARWCTRADEMSYNQYTEYNTKPLYIIRNWETGNAYQMAIRGNKVDFLDQDDYRGDEISKGDFTAIPDELLKKIPYGNNESMLDFKKAIQNAKDELKEYNKKQKSNKKEEEKLVKQGYFKDPSMSPGLSTRWGKTEKVTSEISKNVFLNYADASKPEMKKNPFDVSGFNGSLLPNKLSDYNSKQGSWNSTLISGNKRKLGKYTKHNGNYAVKYYMNNNKNCYILITTENDKDVRSKDIEKRSYPSEMITSEKPATKFGLKYYIYNEETKKTREVKKEETFKYYEKNADKLIRTALEDFGINKAYERYQKNGESVNIYSKDWEFLNDAFEDSVRKNVAPVLKDEISETGYEIGIHIGVRPNAYKGGILPKKASFYLRKNNETILSISLIKDNDRMNYHCDKINDFGNVVKDKESLKNKIDKIANKLIMDYSREALKNTKLQYLRINNRNPDDKENRLKYEEFVPNYFPY